MRKIIILTSFALACCICGAGEPPNKPGNPKVEKPIGKLGYPIGTYLTIEGVHGEDNRKGGNSGTFFVDRIGDYKLKEPVSIWIQDLELRPVRRYILNGYESGGWFGIPLEVPLKGPGPQAGWHFHFCFIVTSVGTNETQSGK